MATTRRTATTRSASTTENTVQRNGTTARQRVLIAAEQAKSAAAVDAAKKETDAREQQITVVVDGYDEITGGWRVRTPDGGTVIAQSLTDGALSAGLRLPLTRPPGSQTATINAPPAGFDFGPIIAQIEASQRDMVQVLAVQVQDRDPDGVADARYPGDKWLNNSSNSLFIWDAAGAQWISISGNSIIYGEGNPNGRLANQDDLVPWVEGGQYYDTLVGRMFVAAADDTTEIKWNPAGIVSWDESMVASFAAASGFYPGDLRQGTAAHGIEGSEGGMFYRFSRAGEWVPQFTCCEEVPEPPPPPCQPAWFYGSGPFVDIRNNTWFPCS